VIAAIFGLIGVITGSFLSALKDWLFNRATKKNEQKYLAVQLSHMLERLISSCVDVVYDDGLFEGQRDQNGCRALQVEPPTFEPLQLQDVDWKSLPVSLMSKILRIPFNLQDVEQYVAATMRYVATAPDYEEVFEARKEKYSELGLAVAETLQELCALTGIPYALTDECEWAPVNRLKVAYKEVQQQKKERNESAQIPPPISS